MTSIQDSMADRHRLSHFHLEACGQDGEELSAGRLVQEVFVRRLAIA